MHTVLLIDELLRSIFGFYLGGDRGTLISAALTCKAWSNPALDHLWARLSTIAPILQLIPGATLVNGVYCLNHPADTPYMKGPNMGAFLSYASRVKHVQYRQATQIDSAVLNMIKSSTDTAVGVKGTVLSGLRSAHISFASSGGLQTTLSTSPQLRELDIDLGFRAKVVRMTVDDVCQLLEEVKQSAPALVRVSLRGMASSRLNTLLASMSSLHCLSLRSGTSLTTSTLLAIMSFPLLTDLELQAGHLDADELSYAWSLLPQDTLTFPSLQKLHVRARATVIKFILEHLNTDALRTLRIEVEDPADTSIAWAPVFDLICIKAQNTLQDLTIEHHIDIDDLEPSHQATDTPVSTHSNADDATHSIESREMTLRLPFDILGLLRHLHCLRKLVFDMTFPPNVCDQDVRLFGDWWPNLQHLDLGTLPAPTSSSASTLTMVALATMAERLRKLESLILPADADQIQASAVAFTKSQGVLRRLSFTFPCTPEPAHVAGLLRKLFPNLEEVDGMAEQAAEWEAVSAALHGLRA